MYGIINYLACFCFESEVVVACLEVLFYFDCYLECEKVSLGFIIAWISKLRGEMFSFMNLF